MGLKRVKDLKKIEQVKNALMEYSRHFAFSTVLDSNSDSNEVYQGQEYDLIAAFSHEGVKINKDVSQGLKRIWSDNDWYFLSISYDLKNELENLSSKNKDRHEVPVLSYFKPQILLTQRKGDLQLHVQSEEFLDLSLMDVIQTPIVKKNFESTLTQQEYCSKIKKLKYHILRGDIYEANFCHEYFIDNIEVQPELLWKETKNVASTPFSTFFKAEPHYVISGSPERFIKKNHETLISQPIKGTIARGESPNDDLLRRDILKSSLKEQNENVMIVDLVRNDLSKIAEKGSVKVDELFGVYGFSKVFQMISTISCKLSPEICLSDIFRALFPMGSMTGAPKIKAMKIIDSLEEFKRGIYSGTVGYIDPDRNFDFNVIIRSLLYNSEKKYLSYAVGGAITKMSDPEKEWEECSLKAETMKIIFRNYASRT